ncbi:MAG TPA: glycosyltransferase family 39 protein [Streptosporangiaceae bacterium]|nr:glycosyltransferase family 39 protein [Streptosporangiaceae bacterium]
MLIGHRDRPPEETAAGTHPGRRRTPTLTRRLTPAALTLGYLAVVLPNVRVPTPSDQVNYMHTAELFPAPLLTTNVIHQVTRFGLIIPMRLAIAVFGYSETAYHIVPILATLTLLLGTYALGTQLFSRPVGVAAAVVVVATTPVFADAADPLPDVFAAGLFTVALSIALALRRRRLEPRWWVLAGLGLVLGWSYLVREFIVFVWPLIPIVLYRRVGWRGLAWMAAPMAVLALGETLLCWQLYGNPLARFNAVTNHAEGPVAPEVARSFRDKPRHVYLLRLPAKLNTYPEGGWLLGLLTLTLVGGLLWRRRLALIVTWGALLWVPLTLLGGILDPSRPKLRLQLIRYWFPIFPAFVLGGLGALWLIGLFLRDRIGARAANRPPLGAVAAAVPLVLVIGVAASTAGTAAANWWGRPGTPAGGERALAAFRTWMSDHDTEVRRIWTDSHTARVLRFYQYGPYGGLAWRTPIARARPGGPTPTPGDLVLFFDTKRARECGFCRKSASEAWGAPPRPRPGWREVYATRDDLVHVYAVTPSPPPP